MSRTKESAEDGPRLGPRVIVIELALPLYDEAEKGARIAQRGNIVVVVGDRQQIVVLKPVGAMKKHR